jgi:hypothetical protein
MEKKEIMNFIAYTRAKLRENDLDSQIEMFRTYCKEGGLFAWHVNNNLPART